MDNKCRVDVDLSQHQEEQDKSYCEVCARTLTDDCFENTLVCTECENDGYWTGNVFIDAGDHAHIF